MKIIFILLVLVIGIIYIFSRGWTETNNVQNTSTSLNQNKTEEKDNIKNETKDKSINANINNSLDYIAFEDLTEYQINEINHNCGFYYYELSNGTNHIEEYINNYKKHQNTDPSEAQIHSINKIIDKCEKYVDFNDALKAGPHYANDPEYKEKISELYKSKGNKKTIEYLEADLFNQNFAIRNEASHALLNSQSHDWIDSVNKLLEIDININEARSLMTVAIDQRYCELGLIDCSVNGFRMLNACKNIPSACNVTSYRDLTDLGLTGFESIFVDKYLSYLRGI